MARDYQAELKKEVARAYRGRVADADWAQLVDSELVADALRELEESGNLNVLGKAIPDGGDWGSRFTVDGERAIDRLVHVIEFLTKKRSAQGEGVQQPHPATQISATATTEGPRQYTPILLTDEEEAQTRALSALTAARASKWGDVLDFRERYLGGHPHPGLPRGEHTPSGHSVHNIRLRELMQGRCPGSHVLTDREALRFLRSPALAYFTGELLAEWEVSFIDHHARWTNKPSGRRLRKAPGRRLRKASGHRLRKPRIRLRNANGEVIEKEAVGFGAGAPSAHASSPVRGVPVTRYSMYAPHSVLADLHAVAKGLVQRAEWDEEAAVWWILTGRRVPMLDPFRLERIMMNGMSTVRMSVYDWVKPERVMEVYAQNQGGGQRTRSRSAKTLLVAEYVLRHAEHDGMIRAEWDAIWKGWNVANANKPGMQYSRRGDFVDAYKRGLATLGAG